MRTNAFGIRDSDYGAVEWIRRNADLRESNFPDFLYGAQNSAGRFRATLSRRRRRKNPRIFTDTGGFLNLNTVSGLGTLTSFPSSHDLLPAYPYSDVGSALGVDRELVSRDRNRNHSLDEPEKSSSVALQPFRPLPFDDNRFDRIAVSSSVQQLPDLSAILREVYRVLKPGGVLRLDYEAIDCPDRKSRLDAWLSNHTNSDETVHLVLSEKNSTEGFVKHYGAKLRPPASGINESLRERRSTALYEALTPEILDDLCRHRLDTATWTTTYPPCPVLSGWLEDIGFTSVKPTSLSADILSRLPGSLGADHNSEAVLEDSLVLVLDIPAGFPRGVCGRSIRGGKK
jgi:SAM-dependent methyltransferase